MNKQHICLMSLVMIMAATIAMGAEEINASTNIALNNTTLEMDINQTAQNSTMVDDANSSEANAELLNNKTINQNVQNLSTVNGQIPVAVSISEIAKDAPTVAAVASSAQVSQITEGAYKLGSGIGGLDPFNPEHRDIESLNVGIPIKPLRDTSKMFFVCDIV